MLTSQSVASSSKSPTSLPTPPPADDALIGRIIAGKFKLGQRIGIGAAGSVYRAEQTSLGRSVAVKVLRPELAGDPRFIRRFHDEALAASRLNHPNVVSVIDFGQTDDGLLYLIMEFLRGVTLTELLRSEELSAPRIGEIVRQILSALEEAHACGVIHADLKSDNILIEQRRGGWDLVKVVDFGIARLTGTTQDEDAAEQDDTICGTPEYMAPEVIRGDDPTAASDIYAVGIMLYELIVGYTPFSGVPVMEVLQRQIRETAIPPSERETRIAVPAYLEEATLRALEKDPERRFANAQEFFAALEQGKKADVGDTAPSKQFTCDDCQATSAQRFKFCPECGASYVGTGSEFELALDDTGHEELWSDDAPTTDIRPEDVEDYLSKEKAGRSETSATTIFEGEMFPLPLVGRERELEEIADFAGGGSPGVLHLVGCLGLGSSRLLREACEEAATSGESLALLAGPDPTSLATPFFPIRAMVGAMLKLPPICSFEELGEALQEIGLNYRDLPGIGELFEHDGTGLKDLESAGRRRELFSAVMRVFRTFAKRNSAVLVFEDLHLYDQPSQELVQQFVEGNERNPQVSIIVSTDDRESYAWVGGRTIELAPLSDEEMRSLVTYLATRGHPDLLTLEELRTLTDGNLLYIHQLLRYAIEGGSLEGAPESLADLVAARVDFLPGAAQRVLQAAAIFGLEVLSDDLTDILANSMGRIEMNAALTLLQKRSILAQSGDIYHFENGIVRYVVYESTPKHVHRILHQAAGDILLASISDPTILGLHAEQAGTLERASELLIRAGDNAVRQHDDVGAAAIYHRALKATRSVLLSDESTRLSLQLIAISIKLADVLRATDQTGLARGILVEAKSFCSQSPSLQAQLYRAEAQLRASEGDLTNAILLSRQAIALAIPILAVDVLTDSYLDLATMLLREEKPDEAVSEMEEAVDLITMGEGPSAAIGPKNFWRILLRLGQLYGARKHPKRAIKIAQHAARLAESVGNRVGVARANATLAGLYEKVGDLKNARIFRRIAIDDMRTLGDRRSTAELLLSGSQPTETIHRISPESIREARLLAEEVGWDEGIRRAKRATIRS